MTAKKITRRSFIAAAAVTGAVSMGCPRRPVMRGGVQVFKRSGRGVHVSNAAKKHNANMLYRTRNAAQRDKPHKGDNSYVVELTISQSMYDDLFGDGQLVADLRHDL